MITDPVVVYNERLKLFASSLNAIALGLIGFAILRPISESVSLLSITSLWWGAVGLVLHGVSHYILGNLKKG